MKLIVECSQKLVRLGENLWNKEQKLDKAEPLNIPIMTTEFVKEHGLPCPNDYIFKDENGNVINATKIVLEKKKKEYPKTYEECCKILNTDDDSIIDISVPLHYNHLLISFTQLIICRDAYWKIAGEEMGLGKPWEPDWNIRGYYGIARSYGNVIKTSNYNCDLTFVFPTEEMLDKFKENFDLDIEICKELL